MRRTLFIRLTQPGPDVPATSVVRQPSGEFGRVERASLATLLGEAAADDRVVLLLPAEDAVITTVDLPVRQRARLMQALPFALEEQLADDVDTMHFALGGKTTQGGHHVAAIRADRLEAYLAPFEHCAATVEAAYLDAQLLPLEAGISTALWLEAQRGLLKTDGQALAMDTELLAIALEQLDHPEAAEVWLADGLDAPAGLPADATRHQVRDGIEQLAQWAHAGHGALNLLQGAFRPQAEQSQWWRPWLPAAVIGGILVLLATGYQAVDLVQKRQTLQALEADNIAQFQQLFPAEQRIVDVRTQLEQQLRQLNNPNDAQGFLFLLDQTQQAFADSSSFAMTELQYRDGQLFIGLEGEDLQALERLREQFAQQTAVELEVLSANAGTDGVKVRLRLSPRGGA